jgi:bifunctional DNase/RNase
MEKIKLEIIGLSYSQTQSGAYTLVLGEENGTRRLPILIGGFEAQAIAIQLENVKASRPLTHDLFKSFASAFEINVEEVVIYNLVEGVFFAKLVCTGNGITEEIDARSSDAIALAVRFGCPVYTYEFILSTAGIIMDETDAISEEIPDSTLSDETEDDQGKSLEGLSGFSMEKLQELLKNALDEEAYEKASRIRDEINKRK